MEIRVKKPKAMFTVKRRSKPMLAAIVVYSESTGRTGKVLVSEPISDDFSHADLTAAAKRLTPQVASHDVIFPTGIDV